MQFLITYFRFETGLRKEASCKAKQGDEVRAVAACLSSVDGGSGPRRPLGNVNHMPVAAYGDNDRVGLLPSGLVCRRRQV
jgi:hypothetical protein